MADGKGSVPGAVRQTLLNEKDQGLASHLRNVGRDWIDNDMDGKIDEYSLNGYDRASDSFTFQGKWQGDRRSIRLININALKNPYLAAALFGDSFETRDVSANLADPRSVQTAPGLIIGRKPLKGYVSPLEVTGRILPGYKKDTDLNTTHSGTRQIGDFDKTESPGPQGTVLENRSSYEDLFDYDRQLANSTGLPGSHPGAFLGQESLNNLSLLSTAPGNVFTIYLTVQSIRLPVTGDETRLFVSGEKKIRATVERTTDGRMNILEYQVLKDTDVGD
jgi:hypothetical protein